MLGPACFPECQNPQKESTLKCKNLLPGANSFLKVSTRLRNENMKMTRVTMQLSVFFFIQQSARQKTMIRRQCHVFDVLTTLWSTGYYMYYFSSVLFFQMFEMILMGLWSDKYFPRKYSSNPQTRIHTYANQHNANSSSYHPPPPPKQQHPELSRRPSIFIYKK